MVMVDDNTNLDAQRLLRVVSFVHTFDDVSVVAHTGDVLTAVPLVVVVNDTFLTVSAV
jgi:hypothetical protein